MALPTDAKERKNVPMARGLLDYFPDALAAIADVSRVGNEQHNPGQPMHWAKHLSTDHADCLIRHLVDRGTMDTDGLRHSAKVAWRALALLQMEIEAAEDEAYRLQLEIEQDIVYRVGQQKMAKLRPDQDETGGYDVCCEQPLTSWAHCEGCHSSICEQTGHCMNHLKTPH